MFPFCHKPRWKCSAAALCALVAWAGLAAAETPETADGFDSATATWRQGASDTSVRVTRHERTSEGAYRGSRCEHIAIEAGLGSYAYFTRELPAAQVIEELTPTLWVRADRPGIQLLARIVFPATRDPATGQAVSGLAAGESYSQVGTWQSMAVRRLPLQAARTARYLRAKLGIDVDPRGAYVDQLIVNAYGGPGATRVWLDELGVSGVVPRGDVEQVAWNQAAPATTAGVQLSNGVLLAEGRPMFPRAVQHRGESLAFLQQLGFNTIVLAAPPTEDIVREAARLQLWLVSPTPAEIRTAAASLERPAAAPQAVNVRPADLRPRVLPEISQYYSRVLAWNLGEHLSAAEQAATKALSTTLRQADRRRRRPIVAEVETNLVGYGRHIDYLLVRREPLGGSLELNDYLTWLTERPKLAPGTLGWAWVQTEHSEEFLEQLRRFGDGRQTLPTIDAERIRLMAMAAVAAGHRGVVFQSRSRLDGVDPATRKRAAAVELANLDLQLLEPWGASGLFVGMAESSDPAVRAAVLTTPRAMLVLPLWMGPAAQCVPGQAASSNLTLVVPGAPESHSAYEITPAGFQKLWHKRVAGGMRITVEEFGLASIVLLTSDSSAVVGLSSRLANVERRAAQVARDLAVSRNFTVEQIDRRLRLIGRPVPAAEGWLQQARQHLSQADAQLAANNDAAAYQEADRALRPLRMLERAHWELATRGLVSPCVSPLTVAYETLPAHYGLGDSLRGARAGGNLLAAGDFEDPGQVVATGWKNVRHDCPGVTAEASFANDFAHSGRSSLKLSARANDPKAVIRLLESAPIWVTTPEVHVGAGQLVRITGHLKIDSTLTGSVDGLVILDSLGGESLAWRAGRTTGWQEFVLYRASGERGTVQVTFALAGLGQALIDDVRIETISGPTWPR